MSDVSYKELSLNGLWKNNPAIVRYFEWVGELASDGDFTMIQKHSGRYRGGVSFCNGCNTTFQGMAADGIKEASWLVRKEFYNKDSALFGSRTWLLLHDELLLEVPAYRLHTAAMRASAIMVDTMHKYTKTIKPKAEPAAMLRWYKDAEPVYEGGRLVPWEPS